MIRLLLSVLLAAPLFAQLDVSLYTGSTEQPLQAATNLGSVAMGDSVEYRFHARNNTNAGVDLKTLSLAGQGFTISSKPTLPYTVAPLNYVEFRVTFTPTLVASYSAVLGVNGLTYMLAAGGVGSASLSALSNPTKYFIAGDSIDCGRVQRKRSTTITLQLSNTTKSPVSVTTVTVRGDAFQGPGTIRLPVTLPSAASTTFQITFAPTTAGTQLGTLTVDNRTFNLTGTAFDAPLPQPRIMITGVTSSASQPTLSIVFDVVPETAATGTLTLDFQPTAAIAGDDPTVLFPATGTRRLSFQVTEGDSTAVFDKQKSVPFQTGTTAGVISFAAQVTTYNITSTVTIAAAPVTIDKATTIRRTSDLDVTLTGFDNTRTSGKFNFTFYDRSGATVAPGAIHLDATADFGRYFAISRVGGAFLTRITFPVTGDATQLSAVDVEIVNSAGTTKTSRLSLQ